MPILTHAPFSPMIKSYSTILLLFISISGCQDSYDLEKQLDKHQITLSIDPRNCFARGQVARIYQEKLMFKAAISEFEKVVEYCPDDFTSQFQLGISLLLIGEKQPGLEQMRKAIKEAEDQGKSAHADALKDEVAVWASKL